MSPLAFRFFLAGGLFGLLGMVWGIQMSASGDHSLSPAHGHLNLVGFVMSAVFGAAYGLAGATGKLASAQFWLHVLAVIVLIPGIALAITEQGEALAKIGSLLAVASLVLFLVALWRERA